jgi:hypothetical protein
MKVSILFFLLFVQITNVFSADLKYPVSEIPADLKENVDVVYREDQMGFKIKNKSSASLYVHIVVTIFNENGNRYARRSVGYDKLSKIVDFNGFAFDATGKQIKRLKNADIYDHAAFDGFSLFSDNRVKSANLEQSAYPYTVEFEYEVEYKYLYSIPGSSFGGEKSATQHASYQLIYPADLEPSFKALNIPNNPVKAQLADGMNSITWILENIKPLKFESNGPDHEELISQIIAAPKKFEYEGYEGDMSSWQSYGKWNLLLNNGRDDLSESTKQKVKELTKNLSTTEQKAKAIYEYLQGKTRYVSIQLGIGGLQPFPASLVEQTGYGDCKALSNYTVAMLKAAGIKSYYTVINAGPQEQEIRKDFPSHQFNHVVVSVPNGKDTLWLECTSQINPFGYQGTFTEDRWALMITDDGGKLVRTINYSPENNLQSRTADVLLEASGNAKAKVKTNYRGIQYETGGLNFKFNSADDQKKWVENNTDIPNFTLNTFSMKEVKEKIPSGIVNLDLTLNRYATVSGKRLFVIPNLMNRISYVPEKMAERKTEVVRKSNWMDLDTINFIVPENLYPEFLPEPIKIKSKFGEYEASIKFDAGKVTYIRRMKVWKGRFPKETYNELVDFYKNVSKADNMKLVFLNKT